MISFGVFVVSRYCIVVFVSVFQDDDSSDKNFVSGSYVISCVEMTSVGMPLADIFTFNHEMSIKHNHVKSFRLSGIWIPDLDDST